MSQVAAADSPQARTSRVPVIAAAAAGVCDSAGPFGIAVGIDLQLLYGVTLVVKCLLLLALLLRVDRGHVTALSYLALIYLAAVATAAFHADPAGEVVQVSAYTAHLALTLCLIWRSTIRAYLIAVVCCALAYATAHLVQTATGATVFLGGGRASFLGGSHPNLGGEVVMIGIVCAVLLRRAWFALPMIVLGLADILLLQSRASLLVASLAAMLWLGASVAAWRSPLPRVAAISALVLVPVVLVPWLWPFIQTEILLFDSSYRGIETGFVGRTERWQGALQLFYQNPLVGVGAGLFETGRVASPHNFYLYALASMGILGLVPALIYLKKQVDVLRADWWVGSVLLSLGIATIFNDRFLNLNPYPFVYHVLLLAGPLLVRADRWVSGPQIAGPASVRRP